MSSGQDEPDNAHLNGDAVCCLFFLSWAKKYSTLHFELLFPPTPLSPALSFFSQKRARETEIQGLVSIWALAQELRQKKLLKSYLHHLQMAVYLFLTKVKSQMDYRYLQSQNCFLPEELGWSFDLLRK